MKPSDLKKLLDDGCTIGAALDVYAVLPLLLQLWEAAGDVATWPDSDREWEDLHSALAALDQYGEGE